jgi:FkbM family methyltransferase
MDLISLIPKALRRRASEYLRARGFGATFSRGRVDEIWIDVGAHLGQGTLDVALNNSGLLVFAFEPNWALARQLMARAVNFVVLPMAVSDKDGIAEFFINVSDVSSSLVPMEESGLEHWKDVDLTVQSKVLVPTIRLDTFLRVAGLRTVDYLKVDAEGVDLQVVQSAGGRLKDIRKIKLEVDTASDRLFRGAPGHDEVVSFFATHDFALVETEAQNDGRQENLTFAQRNPQSGRK